MPKLIPIQVVFASGHMVLVECTHWMQCGIPPLPEMEISGVQSVLGHLDPATIGGCGSKVCVCVNIVTRLCGPVIKITHNGHMKGMKMTKYGHLAFLLVGLTPFPVTSCLLNVYFYSFYILT